MPPETVLPSGALRELVEGLHELYRDAGMPSTRHVSAAVRRNADCPDTISHEVVGLLLNGRRLASWPKVEALVRVLAASRVSGPGDIPTEVRRFHALWLRAVDFSHAASALQSAPRELPSPPADAGPPSVTLAESWRPLTPASQTVTNLPARNAAFCGRADALRAMANALDHDQAATVVLHGPGGSGKTQLALEVAHRRTAHYDVAWWLPAEQPSDLRASLRVLAERLHLDVGHDVNHVVRAVVDRMESGHERWLLVFDNVDDPAVAEQALPLTGGHVIVTTRNPSSESLGRPLAVGVFDRAESIEFLRRRDATVTHEEADRIAARLGDLPLALAQVAAVREATGMSFSRYLQLFDGHLKDLLTLDGLPDYPRGVTATVDLAVRQVNDVARHAADALELFAHFGPEPVPLSLLRSGSSGDITPLLSRCLHDPFRLERAVRDLARFGLVWFERDRGLVTMHRVVRECLRGVLSETALQRGHDNVHALLAAANPRNPDDERTWELHSQIAPHVLPTGLLASERPDVRRLVVDQVRYLYQTGDYEGSSRLAEAARQAWTHGSFPEELGPDQEMAILAVRHAANALRELGQYTSSKQLTDDLLKHLRSSRTYGERHPLTLFVALSEGVDLLMSGDCAAARAAEERNLELALAINGVNHPRTLNAKSNHTMCLRWLGDFDRAYREDVDVLSRRSRMLDVHDHVLIWCELNIAWDLEGLGDYEEMLERAFALSDGLARRLGPGHLQSLRVARLVAVALRCTGRLPEAVDAARRAYRQHVRHLGADHLGTLSMTLSYVNTLQGIGQLELARRLATEAQESLRGLLGLSHPLTLASSVTLATVLRNLGEASQARRIDAQALSDLTRKLGEGHPFAVCAANGLAGDLVICGDASSAVPLAQRTLAAASRRLATDHPVVVACSANASSAGAAASGKARAGHASSWHELLVEPPPL